MKIILALLLATTTGFGGGHDKIENHNIYNGYNMITQATGIQVSCLKCGHKLKNKECHNKNCIASVDFEIDN